MFLSTYRQHVRLCDGWNFLRLDTPDDNTARAAADADTAGWETVSLPHTPRLENTSVVNPFQGICWYRKTIAPEPSWRNKIVVLEFGAGMQIADVWVNGQFLGRHLGGYLPFSADLSEWLAADREAVVAVRLDNRDTDLCPPGKILSELDFSYFGGLYREARLEITELVSVSDPLRANQEAGGGVFIRCEAADTESATISVQTHVVNHSPDRPARKCRVVSTVLAPDGSEVLAAESFPLLINAQGGHHFKQTLTWKNPLLWHPDHPHLYRLVTRVFVSGAQTDETVTRFGVKRIHLTNCFFLNGKELRLRGTNRHQEYPKLGNAVPKNAQRRDARLIKDAGFNFVRLSHYPQDPAFLEACDELGLLVQAAIPGWQQFHNNKDFIGTSFQDIRQLIRRDRNHACVAFWEPNLNETGVGEDGEGHNDWCRAAHEIAHAEHPGDQCLTFGDDYPPKPGWHWDVRGLWREYGDFSFGGNESTSRHTRGEGEQAMLQQAWNFLWTFNHLGAKFSEQQTIYHGSATWVMFDYNRGYYHKPCTCGMADIMRLPKFVYYFYQSQQDREPALFIASHWLPRAEPAKVVVFSNCDEVELQLNGKTIARQKPDSGPDTEYSVTRDVNLATVGDDYDRSGGNPFDGGNCRQLAHPPFTFFNIPWQPGTLTAIGYQNGKPVARHEVSTPGAPAQLRLEADLQNIPLAADGTDVVFIRARILDADGHAVPDAAHPVRFSVTTGDAQILGEPVVDAEGGIASVLLRAGRQPGAITVSAEAVSLSPAGCEVIATLPVWR